MIKVRKAKLSKRGIYIQDRDLNKTVFKPSTAFVYEIDANERVITIRPSERKEKAKNHVSKRVMKDYIKPVIDIREKSALSLFEGAEHLVIRIEENLIQVTGEFADHNVTVATTAESLQRATSNTRYKPYFERVLKVAEPLFNQIGLSNQAKNGLKLSFDVISLFSGCGIMDEGFVQEGFNIKFALDKNHEAVNNYRLNHDSEIAHADICEFDKSKFGEIGAPVMIGGSPCQGFSNANRYTNFLDNPNNLLVREYIDAIKCNPNCQVFILENVPRLLACGEGQFKQEIFNELSDFDITAGVLCAADYGTAQIRSRAFIIGSKIGHIELPTPTHDIDSYITVEQALWGLNDDVANQLDFTVPKAETVERMKYIRPGSNWRDLPLNLKSEGMIEGKTHSNVLRRLSWKKPSIALCNIRKSNILHPSKNRSLTIRECARLFDLRDNYIFAGSLSAMQQMLCNSIPLNLTKAVARVVKRAIEKFNLSNCQMGFTY